MVVWMQQGTRIQEGSRYIVKHTTRTAKAVARELQYRLDVNDLHRDDKATSLGLNEIGRVTFRMTQPMFMDEYRRNRFTGSFILIDEHSGATVAAPWRSTPTATDLPDSAGAVRWERRAGTRGP